jgi:hypothetical protein
MSVVACVVYGVVEFSNPPVGVEVLDRESGCPKPLGRLCS